MKKTYIGNGDNMIEKIKDFVKDDTFQMIIKEESLYVTSFKRLISLEENFISFDTKQKRIKVYGEDLLTQKILEKELLITGKIEKIEVFDAR